VLWVNKGRREMNGRRARGHMERMKRSYVWVRYTLRHTPLHSFRYLEPDFHNHTPMLLLTVYRGVRKQTPVL
jgi:hypothetical protein